MERDMSVDQESDAPETPEMMVNQMKRRMKGMDNKEIAAIVLPLLMIFMGQIDIDPKWEKAMDLVKDLITEVITVVSKGE